MQSAEPSGTKETILGLYSRIALTDKVKYVGLAMIPAECGGGAVLVTGKE